MILFFESYKTSMRIDSIKSFLENKRNIIFKLTIALIISLFFAIFGASVYSALYPEGLYNIARTYINKSEKQYDFQVSDFSLINYTVNGNELCTTTNDPMMILNNDINTEVSTITLNFREPLKNNIEIQVYYTNNGSDFNADQVVASSAQMGDNSTIITIDQYIEKLRIDIGTQPELQFSLENVEINDSITISEIAHLSYAELVNHAFRGIWNDRFVILLIVFMFISVHFIYDIKRMYQYLFKNRWIVAGALLLFLVLNKYNGDSITQYEYVVQSGQGSEYVQPVFGVPRSIRSDEWLVNTPSLLSSTFSDNAFAKYNEVMRGTDSLNSAQGIYKGYSTIGKNIFLLAFFVLETEYAYSFFWYAPIILFFLISIELFMIISKRKPLLSVTGAFLIVFSSYSMWWGLPIYLLAAQSVFVCAYYFLNIEEKWKKILLGIGTAIAASMYINCLYPAWQVPMGYVALIMITWIIYDNWDKVKKLDKMDWIIFGLSFAFMLSLVVSYLLDIKEYTTSIMQTVYPGKRRPDGTNSFYRLFYYFQSILYPYKETANPSDVGVFINFFPVPIICVVYLWFKQKKKDVLTAGLVIISVFLLIYSTVGFPDILTKVTLLSYSTSKRTTDIIGYIQIYFIIIILSRFDLKNKMNHIAALIIGVGTALVCYYYSSTDFPGYASQKYSFVAVIVIAVVSYCLLTEVSKRTMNSILIGLILVSMINGVTVRPILKGLDAIYSKPVVKEIEQIMTGDKDAKWLAYGGGVVLPGYAVACGAPTINSVNQYPNMELWHTLDPSLTYEEVYNRYAHVNVNLTNEKTSMELMQTDVFTLNLNYNDVYKAGVDYILSIVKIDEDAIGDFKVEMIYNEYGCYIYKVIY